jgi:hypothetical protein
MNRIRQMATCGAVALLMATAGCSSAAQDGARPESPAAEPTSEKPPVTTTAAPTPSETPTPAAMTIEEAGAKYLELVAPSNDLVDDWKTAYDAHDTAAIRRVCADRAAADRAFADAMVAASWPASVQATVDDLLGEVAASIPVYLQIAASTDEDDTWDLVYYGFPESQGSAQKLRILLGLPDVPVAS